MFDNNLRRTFARRGWRLTLLLTACTALLSGQQVPAPDANRPESVGASKPAPVDYVLGPDDQLSIWALGVTEMSARPVRIDPNGNLDLPLLDSMHAGGLTLAELKSKLLESLKQYVREPQVTISIAEFRSQPVSVIGEVRTPGIHQLAGRKRLIEVLSLAGGLQPEAGNRIKITRRLQWGDIPLPNAKIDETGKFSVAEVNVKQLLEAHNPAENILICPHDVVSVPRSAFIYVMGEVSKPGGFALAERDSFSVLQALSLAGGVNRAAAPQRARILRATNGRAQREELEVDVKQILAGKHADVPLQPEDILFIPNNTAKSAGIRALETAIQLGTGVIIFRR